jgi:hypothetical protein
MRGELRGSSSREFLQRSIALGTAVSASGLLAACSDDDDSNGGGDRLKVEGHDQVEAITLGDRIGIMNQGRLVQVGRPSEIYTLPADRFVAGFIGSPAMSFVDARVRSAEEGAPRPLRTACASSCPRAPAGEESTWEIELIEDLGAERVVSVVRGPNRLRTRLSFRELPGVAVGDRAGVRLDAGLIHYFDADGRRIDVPAEGGNAPLAVASGA